MTAAPPPSSGLPDVDRQWGGLAAGGAYLLVGRVGAGRSALALQTVRAAVEAGERCLLISPRAPESLVEVGQGIGLDLAAAHQAGSLRLLRIPSAATLAERGPEGLAASYRDLAGLVARDQPGRVVIEDFTPLVQFDTFERFQEAFSDLVQELRAQGAALVIGLGDPANEASRRLLDVVEGLVDGTVRLEADGGLALSTPAAPEHPPSDGASAEADPSVTSGHALAADPEPGSDEAEPAAEPADPADDSAPSAPDPEPQPSSAVPDDLPAPADDAPADGSQLSPEAAGPGDPDGPLSAPISSPPPPDPSLLADGADPFGRDPADALFEQGFLADSGRQPAAPAPGETPTVAPAAAPPAAPGAAAASPAPADSPAPAAARPSWTPAPTAAPQPPPASAPSFAPLASLAPPDPSAAFRSALDAAFAARTSGTPFLVVALRMDPAAPGAAHFGAVEAGLRSSLRPGDRLLVDGARRRAVAVLPASADDDGQALLGGVQVHLRAQLDRSAEDVIQSIAAVTIVDGQPFQSAEDLLAYAVDG